MEQLRRSLNELLIVAELDPSKMQQWKSIGASIGKTDIVDEIKNAYITSSAPLIEDIRRAALTGVDQNLKKHFHKMKSGCGNLGFVRLQRICEFCEDYLKHTRAPEEEIKYICVHIDEEFKKTLDLLETL